MSPEQIRLKLRARGFLPIPVNGKSPGFNSWQKQTDAPPQQIHLWIRQWPEKENTGVLTARTPTIDLDILNLDAADAAERLVREFYEEKGRILVRFGKRPKRAIPFRTDEPFDKITVTFVAAPAAPEEKIEMLCKGQQCVVHGVHPDTGRPYEWFGGSLDEIQRDDLPDIRAAEARELVDAVVALLVGQFGYRVIEPKAKPKQNGADDGSSPADWSVTRDELIDHDKLAALAMRFVRAGMTEGACVNFLKQNVRDLELLAALRELADGAWTRHLGTDGGRTLSWKGKLGIIFGVTPAIDAYHGVIGSLGDRWLLTRMAPVKGQLAKAFQHRGKGTKDMRAELAEAVARLFAGRRPDPRDIIAAEIERIDRVVSLVVRLRGTVERDRRTGELDAIYGAEGGGRIGLALERLLAGLDTLGIERETAMRVIESVALDSVPTPRRSAYNLVATERHRPVTGELIPEITTTEVATALGLPTNTARRILEDLTAYGLLKRHAGGSGNPDKWSKASWENEGE